MRKATCHFNKGNSAKPVLSSGLYLLDEVRPCAEGSTTLDFTTGTLKFWVVITARALSVECFSLDDIVLPE